MRGPNARVTRLVCAVQQAIRVTNSQSCPRWVAPAQLHSVTQSVQLVQRELEKRAALFATCNCCQTKVTSTEREREMPDSPTPPSARPMWAASHQSQIEIELELGFQLELEHSIEVMCVRHQFVVN